MTDPRRLPPPVPFPPPVSLLPSNATPWEDAHSVTNAERRPLPAYLIRDVTDPWRCPPDLLGYLASAHSVDIWREEWPIEFKRFVVGRAFLDHRLKGTLAGITRYVEYAGSRVIAAETFPSRFILGAALSPAERSRLLSGMPEVRVYPFASSPPRGAAAFFNRDFRTAGRWHTMARTVETDHELRAELHRDGQVVPLRVALLQPTAVEGKLAPFERLYLPHFAGAARILGARNARRQRFWGRSRAAEFVVSFRREGERAPGFPGVSVGAGLEPAEAAPRRVFRLHGGGSHRLFFGRAFRGRFRTASDATAFTYDALRLWDPERAPVGLRGRSFWGHARRGLPPYTAYLSLDVPVRGVRGKRHWGGPFRGALHRHDGRALEAARDAVRASMTAHDDIWIDTETFWERRLYGAGST